MAEGSDAHIITFVPQGDAVFTFLENVEERAKRAINVGGNGAPGTQSIAQGSTLPPPAGPASGAAPVSGLPPAWQAQVDAQMGGAASAVNPATARRVDRSWDAAAFAQFRMGERGQQQAADRSAAEAERLRQVQYATTERLRRDEARDMADERRAQRAVDRIPNEDRNYVQQQALNRVTGRGESPMEALRESVSLYRQDTQDHRRFLSDRARAQADVVQGYRSLARATISDLNMADRRDLRQFNAAMSEVGPNTQLSALQQRMSGLDPSSDEFQDLRRRAGSLRGRTGLHSEIATTGMFMAALFSGWEVAGAGMSLRRQERFAQQNPTDLVGQLRINEASIARIQSGPIGAQVGMFGELMGDALESAEGSRFGRFAESVGRYVPLGYAAHFTRYGRSVLDTRRAVDEANNILASSTATDAMVTARRGIEANTRVGRVALGAMDPAEAQRASAEEEFREARRSAGEARRTAMGRNVSAGQRAIELHEINAGEEAARSARDVNVAIINRQVTERIAATRFANSLTGQLALLEGGGQSYAAQELGIRGATANDVAHAKSFDELLSAQVRGTQQLAGLAAGNARETGMNAGRLNAATLASLRARQGDSYGAAIAGIRGKFLPQFGADGELSGFDNLDRSNPEYQKQFRSQRDAYFEAIGGADQGERSRQMMLSGMRQALNRRPLDAELLGISASTPNAEERGLRGRMAMQEFADERQDSGLALMGQRAAIGALEDRNPMGANVANVVAQAQMREVSFRRRHMDSEATQVRELTRRQLNVMERDYREGFQYQQLESKLLLPGLFSKRANEDPEKVFASFRAGRSALSEPTDTATPEGTEMNLSQETIDALSKGVADAITAQIQR